MDHEPLDNAMEFRFSIPKSWFSNCQISKIRSYKINNLEILVFGTISENNPITILPRDSCPEEISKNTKSVTFWDDLIGFLIMASLSNFKFVSLCDGNDAVL